MNFLSLVQSLKPFEYITDKGPFPIYLFCFESGVRTAMVRVWRSGQLAGLALAFHHAGSGTDSALGLVAGSLQ